MTRGERVIRFIEKYCRVPEGKLVGQPMVLAPFQKRFILEVYDNPDVTRQAYLSIGRKNGKSGLIAGIILAHVAGPEAKQNSQIASGARSREQASVVHALASKMVQMSPELSRLVRVTASGKRLFGLAKNVEFRALSAEAKTTHGLSPVLAILDEVGQIRGSQDDFVDAITTAQGAHQDPLVIAISTQAPNDGDLFLIWIDDARRSKDPHTVCHVYEADKDCDVEDEVAWAAANPGMGLFRSEEDVRQQANKAKRMPSFEAAFRNLILNQRVEMSSPLIPRGVWLANSFEADLTAFYEAPVYCGLDLSARADLTAFVMIAFKDGRWHVKPTFWTPEKGLIERSKRDRQPYDVWHRQGLLRTTPGATVDYDDVAKDIAELLQDCNVVATAFDRWRIDVMKKSFAEIGFDPKLVPFGQGFKDMSPAIEAMEDHLYNDRVSHGNHPVLTMCAANAKTKSDEAGNRKVDKIKSTGRIDGIAATTMAFGATLAEVAAKPRYQAIIF